MVMTTKNMNEAELVREAQGGSRRAFKAIFDSYGSRVFNLCYRITGNRQDAEDVAQDVFVEVYRHLGKFRGDSSLSTWILRIAHNRSLNFLRDRKPAREVSFDTPSGDDGVSLREVLPGKSSDRPDRTYEIERNRAVLYESIASLPEKLQKPFSLHKLDQMPYEEIARTLNLSLSAVESRIHRAKLRLQKEIVKKLKKTGENAS